MKRILILVMLALIFAPTIEAAKARVRKPTNKAVSAVSTCYSKAKLSRGTNSVPVTFLNLTRVAKVTYTLSYTANGVEQGVVGSITPTGQATDTRDLYFGTCSHGV